jgi:hypothetical protein
MTLTCTLSETDTKELKRALKSQKCYLYFAISVFNSGAAIRVKCTNNYTPPAYNTWNGYDFILENDETTKYYINQELKNRQ